MLSGLRAFAVTFFIVSFALLHRSSDAQWTPLEPNEMKASDAGIAFARQADGSILVSGANPPRYDYVISASTDVEGISAFRLEYFTDSSLPKDGPGRWTNGNFQLSEFEVSATPKNGSKSHAVKFKLAAADRWQGSGVNALIPSKAIDGIVDAENGWAPEGHVYHRGGEIVFVTAEKEGYRSGTLLEFKLRFQTRYEGHGIGRFRLSLTNALDIERHLPMPPPPDAENLEEALDKGVAYLLTIQQPDGSWVGPDATLYYGMTALGAYTLMKCGLAPDHPAVRAALSWMAQRPCERTYDMGVTLMTYRELGTARPADRVAALTRRLIETFRNGTRTGVEQWGYPGGYTDPRVDHRDLSNTQYALLGLRAAAAMGEKVPSQLYIEVAEDLMSVQGGYGGYSYKPDTQVTASMTVAGITCLLVCLEELRKTHEGAQIIGRLESSVKRALSWLETNWSVEKNLPETNGRWTFYYLYGLERVGSIGAIDRIGTHDWHREGATFLVKAQKDRGAWASEYGEDDANTCFALLFMRRASRVSGLSPRARERERIDKEKPFLIGASREGRFRAWIRTIEASGKAKLEGDSKVVAVQWHFGDGETRSLSNAAAMPFDRTKFDVEYDYSRNGRYTVTAEIEFSDGTKLSSNEVIVLVDDIEEPWHREAVVDHERGTLLASSPTATASSERGGHAADLAIDGRAGTSWMCADDDKRPMLKISLGRSVQAEMLKFSAARPPYVDFDSWARPRDVEVSINGSKPITTRLEDIRRGKHRIAFPKTRVRSIAITIRSVYNGTSLATVCGIGEVELVEEASAEEAATESRAEAARYVLKQAKDQTVIWRYTTEEPAADWAAFDFKDSNWKKGPGAFGNIAAAHIPERTPWGGAAIWLRTDFTVTPTKKNANWSIEICCDDIATVYINGVQAAHLPSYTNRVYRTLPLSPEARAAIRPGRNIIAVHCQNTGGAAVIDVALSY